MFVTKKRYTVREIRDGKVIEVTRFQRRNPALALVAKIVDRSNAAKIKRTTFTVFRIVKASTWGRRPYARPECPGTVQGPVTAVYIHTSVTTQLRATATLDAEKAQMRKVDDIGHGRGFCGFSYSFGHFPSGDTFEGRGWKAAQAATVDDKHGGTSLNNVTYSFCTIGNTDAFKPTKAQVEAIIATIKLGQALGHIAEHVTVHGHREVAWKACPGAKFPDSLLNTIEKRVNA